MDDMSCFFPNLLVEAEACMQGDEAWLSRQNQESHGLLGYEPWKTPIFLKHKPFINQ